MAERDFGVLEQYGCKLYSVSRGRGAFICETNRGPVILREYSGRPEKLAARAALLEYLTERGLKVDYYIRNLEGSYISTDASGVDYTLCFWFHARECDIKSFSDVCVAIQSMARLHKLLEGYQNESEAEFQIARSLREEYDKHNRELKMIRNYLSDKRRKSDFELLAAAKCQEFLSEGLEAASVIRESGYDAAYQDAVSRRTLCHGDYNYHNVFVAEQQGCICGFEQCSVNLRLTDLYNFMRKLMEKYDWDVKMGYLMLREYDNIYHLSAEDVRLLGVMFSYPEKFWKILNYYFNANKAWIPNKNMEKLKLVVKQNRMRREFVRTLYGA